MAGWPAKGGTWAISRRSAHRSVIAPLIGRWQNAMSPPMVAAAKCFTARCKNNSQSIVNAGYFSQGPAAFDRIMLSPKGWYWRSVNRTCERRITFPKIGSAPTIPISLNGGFPHGSGNWRHRAGFRGRNDRRQNPLPRVDREQLGGAVFAPEGFHPGLHHRARHHGAAEARIRQTRRQDHRALGRPGRQPQKVGG